MSDHECAGAQPRGTPPRTRRGWLRVAAAGAGVGLAPGLARAGAAASGRDDPDPDRVAVARAFTAAWNAHDLPAVLALFAPDAVVRERRGPVPPHVWDARDPAVVRAYLDEVSHSGDDPGRLVWVTGHPEIAAWAAARFAERHRYAPDPPRGAGETVRWAYREFVDPFQGTPGISPAEGDAEAVVRGGRIAVLSHVQTPASVRRQWDEVNAAARARRPRPAPPDPARPRPAEPDAPAWPLALGGLAGVAVLALARRHRR